ncbi:MAG TPA: hypothetical protein VFU02_12865 [Polyangiaceae bacterium]|nr:hypothetical protein [Polyangiaceae bacterium]
MFRNRSTLRGTTLALAMFLSRPADAEPTAWLDWSPPPECPSAADIERRVVEWLGGPFPTGTDIVVRTELAWNGARWEVTVEVAFGDQSGTRRISVRDCQEAADFVAVAVALAVDPSVAEKVDPRRPDAADAEPARESAVSDSASRAAPEAQPASERAEEPHATRAVPRAAVPARSPVRPHLSVSAEGATGVLPGPALGLGVAAGGDIGRLVVSLGGHWLPPASTTPEQALAPIDFSLLSGSLRAAYLFLGPKARVGPSVGLEAGAIQAKQLHSENPRVIEPWVALASGMLGLVQLTKYLSVFGELALEFPMTRPTFVLSDASVVHRVGVGGRAALGLRFSLLGH